MTCDQISLFPYHWSIIMSVRRSFLLFVCCYMILFCVLKNINDSFRIQKSLLSELEQTDEQTIEVLPRESLVFHRHLAGIGNGDIKHKTIGAEIDTSGKLIVDSEDAASDKSKKSDGEWTECTLPKGLTHGANKIQNENKLKALLNDCDKFLKEHGYLNFPVTEEEVNFPLAFGIKIHQNPGQAEQLLRTIYRPHNIYCIHVDKKAHNEKFDLMKRIGDCLPNVIVVTERTSVVYASSALVRVELKCMKIVMDSEIKWKYYINLAGQEFPLRTNLEMVKILTEMKGANDIESYNHPVFLDWRIQKQYSVIGNSLVENGKKETVPYNIKLSKGSAYGLFTRNFVEFLLNDRVAREIIQYLNDTFAPEENVWATLNTLPWAPGGYSMEVRHFLGTFISRAVIWSGDSPRCHGNFVRGVCVFKSRDYPWLVKRPEFFANKFDETLDSNILNCLESWYKKRAYNGTLSLDLMYYLKLPHVKYYRDLSEFRKSKSHLLTLKRKWIKENASPMQNA